MLQLRIRKIIRSYPQHISSIRVRPWTWLMLQLKIGRILRSYRKHIPWIRVRPWTWLTLQFKKRRISRSYPQHIPWIRIRPWTWLILQLQIRRTLYIRVTWVKLRVSCYRLTLSLKKRIHPSLWTDYDPGLDSTRPWTWLNLSQTQGQVLLMLTHMYTRETKLSCNGRVPPPINWKY